MDDPPHPQLTQLAQALRRPDLVEPTGDAPVAAVAALLRASRVDSGLELLLIRRAEREGDVWSGHVALPGGRADAVDSGPIATAARETCEEVGIDLDAVGGQLLGALPPVLPRASRVPRIAVYPFVWSVPHDVDVVPNEEVALAKWIELAHLAHADQQVEHRLLAPGGEERSFPAISLGEDVLWGITHGIVTSLLAVLEAEAEADADARYDAGHGHHD